MKINFPQLPFSILLLLALSTFVAISPVNSTASLKPTTISISSKPNPSLYGQSVTFTATITGGVPGGEKVIFFDNNTQIGTATISSGLATFSTSSLTVGIHSIVATYPGDISYATSTNSLIQTVKPAGGGATIISLTATPTSATYGRQVTLTATVAGGVPNGESIVFYDGYTRIGTGSVSSGVAYLIVFNLSGGPHTLTARYGGDSFLAPSTSNPVTESIRPAATSTSLTSSSSGQYIILTATVTSSVQIPNGESVIFKDGASIIGASKLLSGSATFTTSSLSAGTHSITATYSGDANFTASTSPIAMITSNGPGPTNATNNNQPSCLLGLNISSASPYYVAPQKIAIYYTVKRIGTCPIPSATGTLSLSSAVTGVVYSSIPINISSIPGIPITMVAYANSSGAPRGDNLAVMLLSAGTFSNLSSTSYYILQPANISISNLRVGTNNSTAAGGPLSITSTFLNGAFFAADNATLNLKIIAPNLSIYKIQDYLGRISAFQNSTITVNPGAAAIPQTPGRYIMLENISFYSDYYATGAVYSSNTLYSNTASTSYSVSFNKNQGYNATTYQLPPNRIGPLIIKSFPLYTDLIAGSTPYSRNLNNLVVFNPGNYPITINLTASNLSLGRLALSTTSLLLPQNQNGTVQLQFIPYPNTVSAGTYLIPLNISVSANNITTEAQTGLILNIYNRFSFPQVLSDIRLLNGSSNAAVQLSIFSPANSTSYDLILSSVLNSSITNSKSNIALRGRSASPAYSNNTYKLSWSASRLLSNNTVQVGYNISNVTQPRYLLFPATFLSSTKQSNLTALTVFGVKKPEVIYTNSTVNITVIVVYSGTNATTLSISLIPPAGANVLNPQQTFKATPNSAIDAKFTIQTEQYPGNEVFRLITPGAFAAQFQSISLDVQPKPTRTYTIYDYLNDPRTIFGALTLVLYIISLSYGKISKIYRDKKLISKSTVKSLAALMALKRGVNEAVLDEGAAKRRFRRHTNKDGSLGGFVEESAIVGRDVIIAQTAIVENESILSGNARISGSATISGHAVIRSDVTVSGNARIAGDAELYGNAQIDENAKIFGQCEIYDNAKVYGDAEVFDDAKVFGEAEISGKAKIYGSALISGDVNIKDQKISKGEVA